MDTQTQAEQTISLGEQFRQARQALNLSIEQAAAKINLRPIILENIENDELVNKSIPAAFMKGYVRNYGKFLKLPESLWNSEQIYFGDTPKNDLNKTARTKQATNPHGSHRWVGWLTVVVLLGVAGMTSLWWWENYQQSNVERDSLVQNYVSNEQQTETTSTVAASSVATEQTSATIEPITSQNQVVSSQPAESSSPEASAQAMPSTQLEQSAVQNSEVLLPTQNLASQSENSAPETNSNLATATPTGEQSMMQQTATETPENSTAVAVQGDLQIEITQATSWITVKDAKRKNLAQKEYKQGEVLTFDGQGPYALTIGAPANVKITYKGEAYPLKIDGRVARIKLQ